MKKTRKTSSTVEQWMGTAGFKAGFQKEYHDLLLSELVLAIMDGDDKSVRDLAQELGLSKTVIQNLRSGRQTDMKLSNFLKMTQAYGFQVVLEKGQQRIPL